MRLDDFTRQMMDRIERLVKVHRSMSEDEQRQFDYEDALDDVRDILTGFCHPDFRLTETEDGLALYPDAVGFVPWMCPVCAAPGKSHCDGMNDCCRCRGWRWCPNCDSFEAEHPATEYEREV